MTATVTAGNGPVFPTVNPVTNTIYVPNYGSNTVTVIDGSTNATTTVTVGINPYAIAVNPVTNTVYAVSYTHLWEFPSSDDSWAAETAAFVEDVRLARTPSPGLQEGIRTLEIVESIYKKSGFPTS